MKTTLILCSLSIAALAPISAHAQASDVTFEKSAPAPAPKREESNYAGKGMDGKTITLTGTVDDVPRFFNGQGGKYQSWAFRLNAREGKRQFGDEFVLVTVHTVKWGKSVGSFNLKKGEHAELSGTFHESKSRSNTSGIIGSLSVNDLSYQDVQALH